MIKQSSGRHQETHASITRRQFLYYAALSGAALSSPFSSILQASSNENASAGIDMPVIDVHRHCQSDFLSGAEKTVKKLVEARIKRKAYPPDRSVVTYEGISSIVYDALGNIDEQIRVQDEAGVATGILSSAMDTELACRILPVPSDDEITERMNTSMSAIAKKYPGRLAFMAVVNPASRNAVKECERCINELCAKGINISSSFKGEFPDTPKSDPLWEYAEKNGIAVFLHPPLIPVEDRQMDRYRFEEMIGRPVDSTMAAARMIYSGVFDRFPDLKIVVPHMGGVLPSIIGRLDFGYRLGYYGLPEGQAAVCRKKPSEYLRMNFFMDSMGFSPVGVKSCIDLLGSDRVLFGSDYPAVNISPREQIDMVNSLSLNREEKEKILYKNAKALFKLP